jgi:hypothetical protein
VKFGEERRCWFLAEHLVKSVPEKLGRFFRAEVLELLETSGSRESGAPQRRSR